MQYPSVHTRLALLPVGITCFFCSVFAAGITGDAANTGFHLLEEPVNPRFIAMGFSGTALAGKGFASYNPALPFLVHRTYLAAEYGTHPRADLKHTQLETALQIKNLFFGLSLHNESIDNIYETNIWGWLPYYDTPFSAQFTNISLTAGYRALDNLGIALGVNGMQDRIYNEYAYAISFSAGAVMNPIPDRLYIGFSVLNVGFSTPMLGADSGSVWGDGERLPMNSRLGMAWTHSVKDMPYTVAFDIVYRNVRDRDDPFTRHIQERFSFPLGFELRPVPPLALRIGKRINFPTEILNFGIGFNLDPLQVDASFVIPRLVDDAEIKWLTGITFFLKTKKKEPETKPVIDKPAISSTEEMSTDVAGSIDTSDTGTTAHDTTAGEPGIPEDTDSLRTEEDAPQPEAIVPDTTASADVSASSDTVQADEVDSEGGATADDFETKPAQDMETISSEKITVVPPRQTEKEPAVEREDTSATEPAEK